MFNFIMQIEGMAFSDALKTLADRAGVRLKSYDPKLRSEKTRLYEICEKSCQFFEKQLCSSTLGQEAREYLLGRGINEESILQFRVGFAPDTRESLYEFLKNQGYSPAEIFKAGVSIESQTSYSCDRFRGRIMFPIFDLNGQVIGFGGRVFFGKNQAINSELAKYINTPKTLLYDKSRVLYGLDKAKMAIRENDACLLVEGYTDVIASHQAGNKNVVSTSGTALSEYQLDIIRRYTENLVTCFDMDIAGDNATKRGIYIAQNKGFNIKVLTLPEGKDPAEIIPKNKKAWDKAVKSPLSIGEFYFTNAFTRFDKTTPEGIRSISNIVLPFIKKIPSEIERSHWVSRFASELKCSERAIWDDLEKIYIETSQISSDLERQKPANTKTKKLTREDMLVARLLAAIIKDKTLLELFCKNDLKHLSGKFLPADVLIKMKSEKENFSEEERSYLDEINFQEEAFPIFDENVDLKDEVNLCINSLKKMRLQRELYQLQTEMKLGSIDDNILRKFQKVSMELAKL